VLTLDYLELNGFRSFLKKARIQFAPTGLYLLASKNLDTGGSSGGGKSSVVMGINDAFGACEVPRTLLQSWGSKTPASSLLGLKNYDVPITIQRAKKLDITVGSDPIVGSNAQKEEHIRGMFGGLDLETVLALTYRGQRQPGIFLSKTDSEKKAFLTPVLGLDKFEEQAKMSAAAISEATRELVALDSQIGALERQRESLTSDCNLEEIMAAGMQLKARTEERKAKLDFLAKQVEEVQAIGNRNLIQLGDAFQPRIDVAKARCAALRAELRNVQPVNDPVVEAEIARLAKLVDDCAKRFTTLATADNKRRQEMDSTVQALNVELRAFSGKAATKAGFVREKLAAEQELKKLHVDICPTCERDWDKACDHRARLQSKIEALDAQIVEAAAYAAQAEDLSAKIAALPRFEPNPMIAKIQAANSTLAGQLATEKQKLVGAVALVQSERRKEIAIADTDLAQIEAELQKEASRGMALTSASTQEQMVEMEIERRALAKDMDGLTELRIQATRLQTQEKQAQAIAAELATIRGRRAVLDSGLRAEKDFAHLIGREGFLGSIFDEVLQEIGDETNGVLASVANTRHVTLEFRSENVTQKGEVSKEIKPVLTVHGNETSIKGGLSGGMLTTVELATDLAVGAVVSRRSGVCPGWLILDESFDGLDAVSKESCVEILQRYSKDRLVIVVDHASEFQGAFENIISITYENGESRVE
jgi:DNA repair exonuclease SbcCD ATPase subunit